MSDQASGPRKVAFIGLGVMGAPMAGHLLDAGYALAIHTRTKAKAADLLARGAAWADSPAGAVEASGGADVAISIVGYPDDVKAVHLGEAGTLVADTPPRVVVDMTTSRPSLAREIAARAQALGVGSVDAPVSGGDVGARNATLSIMVGGDAKDVAYVMPLLECMGKNIVHQGSAGSGQHTKMVNQIVLASTMVGVCEGLVYAKAAGLEPRQVIASVGSGAAGSWAINNLGPRMLDRDFAPGFYVEHFIKDLGIALEEAQAMGMDLPGLTLAKTLYDELAAMGHSRAGTQALIMALEAQRDRART